MEDYYLEAITILSRPLGACRNSSVCSNVQIFVAKFFIWNEFGGGLEGPLLISSRNCFSSKSFQIAFSQQINVCFGKIWMKNMVRLYFTAQSFSKYGALQDVIVRSHLPITPIKNEWLARVHIWIFGRIGVEKRFGQKTACSDMAVFLPNFGKISQDLRFERDLTEVWNIQIFGNLNI